MNLLKKVKRRFSNTVPTNGNGNRNVTERPNLTEENFFHALLETVSSPITYADRDFRYKYVNKICAEWFGLNPADIIGKPVKELLGEDPYRIAKPYMERAISGEQVRFETTITLKNRIRFVEVNYTPHFDDAGTVKGYVGLINDISERIQAQETENKLASLAAIVQTSGDAIISRALDGTIINWNEGAEKIFGWSAGEMIGQPISKYIPEEHKSEEQYIIDRLKKGEQIEHFETRRLTKDNRVLDVSLKISLVKDKNGNIIGASKIARDITEQKKLYRALQESEERLRMASEATHLGTWEFHPSTKKIIWSDECKHIYGLPIAEEPTREFIDGLTHPDDREYLHNEVTKAMNPESNGRFHLQYRIFRDQQLRWLQIQGKVLFINRQPDRFIGTVLDITEEKVRAKELQDNVDLFTTLADNVPVMIWMSGQDKFCDFFNKTWLQFTGRTIQQESNEGWLESVHPDDVQNCVASYKKAFDDQKPLYTEYRLKRFDGKYRWIADNAVPRYNPDGSFAGFISACLDIDEQQRFREKIMQNELLLKTISNAAPVGLWMTDTEGQVTFVNNTWIEWTGIPFEKQLGIGWLERLIEEDKTTVPIKFLECLLKKEKYSAEFRFIRKDDELRWGYTESFPYYDINGRFAGYAGSVTDITEIKKVEERKDDFITMASHELKTPITSIKGYVQLLLNIYDELNEEKFRSSRHTVKSSLNTISKQVSKLTRLVSELLDLSRIESGKLELQKTEFDLGALVEEIAEDARHTTTRHAIIVNNDFERNIYADRDRIAQVLVNLLANAIKYSPDADCVEILVEDTGNQATIKIKDYGIGIDKKDQTKIFERFYRAEGKSEQTYPGFGIGLFIASEIILRHNGAIMVESEKGRGSVFSFTLPMDVQAVDRSMRAIRPTAKN